MATAKGESDTRYATALAGVDGADVHAIGIVGVEVDVLRKKAGRSEYLRATIDFTL